MKLRPYQIEAKDAVIALWRDVLRVLLVLPTGSGKTIIFANITRSLVAAGKRVLILAHRGELLEQAADKIRVSTGLECAVEKAEKSCLEAPECFFNVVLGSVQSISRDDRLCKFAHDYFDVIIVDEAHHVLSPTYAKICDHFHEARYLGVTATPDRGDMQSLSEFFEALAYEYLLADAIKDGYLKPIKALTVPLSLDLRGCKQQSGDYKSSDIANVLDPYLEDIATAIELHCSNRKTLVFTPLITTSERLTALLNETSLSAVECHGTSKDRAEIIADFHDGMYDVMCNSMLFTEGFDCPIIDCVVVLRPTRIRSLYAQCIGRGTRLHPDSKDLLILDFLWHTDRHQLCMPAHLTAKNAEIANAMIKKMSNGEIWHLNEAEESAESDATEERENSLAMQLESNKGRKSKLIDPLKFSVAAKEFGIGAYEPTFNWERLEPTVKQEEYLTKVGFDTGLIDTRGKANAIINKLHARREKGLATVKQLMCLQRYAFDHPERWTFKEASDMMNKLAANNWRKPITTEESDYDGF